MELQGKGLWGLLNLTSGSLSILSLSGDSFYKKFTKDLPKKTLPQLIFRNRKMRYETSCLFFNSEIAML